MRIRNAGIAVLIALAGCAPALASHRTTSKAATNGIGETILLVVGDVTTPTATAARKSALNTRFGDLSGFSADSTDNYEIKGALVQSSPDLTTVSCPSGLEVFPALIGDRFRTLECPSGSTKVSVYRTISMRYFTRSAFATYVPGACGSVGLPPCQAARLKTLFGSSLRMPSGRSVIATAFRTKAGAIDFLSFARAAGVTNLVVVQAFKAAGGSMGIGQEPNPDGSGPLTHPLCDQEGFQH